MSDFESALELLKDQLQELNSLTSDIQSDASYLEDVDPDPEVENKPDLEDVEYQVDMVTDGLMQLQRSIEDALSVADDAERRIRDVRAVMPTEFEVTVQFTVRAKDEDQAERKVQDALGNHVSDNMMDYEVTGIREA